MVWEGRSRETPPYPDPCVSAGTRSKPNVETASGLVFLAIVLGLNLLLLLHGGPDFVSVLAIIRQPQPNLRHMRQGSPSFAVSKRARHF